ncbi:MAG: NTP transferase domain-containing protein [Actinobacteria bacterium]|nr:NTP transferase domain-containing protein [Actinomycetota bacterium]
MRAVIFAGGRGTRLAPFTQVLPKPLVPIGERSILDLILRQLGENGFDEITLCVGYLAHLIRAVCDASPIPDVRLDYVHEETPLGTAGPLTLVPGLDETFLAMNGDILTTVDYRDLVETHVRNGNVFTIATHERTSKIDYGVLHVEARKPGDSRIVGFEEKPTERLNVSMGIYVLDPRAIEYVPRDRPFDIPDLVLALLAAGEPVGAYPYTGFWLDLGRHEDYEAAVSWEKDRHLLVREGLIPA